MSTVQGLDAFKAAKYIAARVMGIEAEKPEGWNAYFEEHLNETLASPAARLKFVSDLVAHASITNGAPWTLPVPASY